MPWCEVPPPGVVDGVSAPVLAPPVAVATAAEEMAAAVEAAAGVAAALPREGGNETWWLPGVEGV